MTLYYAPHTCSLSPHIVLRELDLPFTLVKVDNRSKRTEHGEDFLAINPKGYVAALQLADGRVLTEGPAILQYLADLKPEAGMAPPAGSWERARLQEMLSFITSELHAGMSPLFNAAFGEEVKQVFRERLFKRMAHVEQVLQGSPWLLGERFGVADAYLFTVLGWLRFFDIGLERWPALARFMQTVAQRPSVQAASAAEGVA
ncbi:glutathione transferase GstA [Herbaspirillum sp. LeCh32-8]|uniref:glutathione transferase GstA n=1 Tax=Herbaspirillum sp. LeCh32-8 TaxID=2821356 RepID=UPI001AE4DD7D|nr:glutathione transferase GstA [Herbaspirillum sp. LeCh32-8]MBP0599008.1 glutathione transferase GstA [Herbaspirillum sp. LeCh32-8]